MKKVTVILVLFVVLFCFFIIPACSDSKILSGHYYTEGSSPVTLYGTISIHGNEPFTYTVITDNQGEKSVLTGELTDQMSRENSGSTFVITGMELEPDPLYSELPVIVVEDYIILQ